MKTAADFQFELTNRPFEFDEVMWNEETVEVKYHSLLASVQAVPMRPTIDSMKLADSWDDTLVVKFHQLVHYDEVKSVVKSGKISHVHNHVDETRHFVGTISAYKFTSRVDTSYDAKSLINEMIDELDSRLAEQDGPHDGPCFSAEHVFFAILRKEDIQLFDSVGRLDIDPEIGDLDEVFDTSSVDD